MPKKCSSHSLIISLLLLSSCFLSAQEAVNKNLSWLKIAELPPANGTERQTGLAGAFAGISEGHMIVAGGANFPKGAPWEGGAKIWWNDIYVLKRIRGSKSGYQWQKNPGQLDRALAYGASVTLDDGLLCIGGCDAESCHSQSFLLKWNTETGKINLEEFPDLPIPLAYSGAARIGSKVYVVGGQSTVSDSAGTSTFLSLDLTKRGTDGFAWEKLTPWEGSSRVLPVVVAQNDGTDDCIFVFSGRNPMPGKLPSILTDAHKYSVASESWTKLPDVKNAAGQETCIMAAPAAAISDNRIAVFGGADGNIMRMLNSNAIKISGEVKEQTEKFSAFNLSLLKHHPGFSREILAFNATDNSWSSYGLFIGGGHVTTPAVIWDGSIVIPSGEVRPGVRSPSIWKAVLKK